MDAQDLRQRAELIRAVRERGEPTRDAARRLGVTASTAFRWLRVEAEAAGRPGRDAVAPTFVELVPARPAHPPSLAPAPARIHVGFAQRLRRIAGVNPSDYLTAVFPILAARVRLIDLPGLLPARWRARRDAAALAPAA